MEEPYRWRKRDFVPPECEWTGEIQRDENIDSKTPHEQFKEYFTDEFFELLSEQTNIYGLQKYGQIINTSAREMKIFFGIHMLMGSYKFPRVRLFWQAATRIPEIANAMGLNRFFKLRNTIHQVNNEEHNSEETPLDKLWKVRPVIETVRKKCVEIPHEENYSIDEQMIPFKGVTVSGLKQVIKSKPTPVGIKNFVRCGAKSGIAYDFEIYQGAKTGVSEEHKYLGLGGSVVVRLCQGIENENSKVIFDNFFTSIPLMWHLKQIGILSAGTIRKDRVKGCTFLSEKELKKLGRESYDFKVEPTRNIVLVRWMDNGLVQLGSTFVGVDPETEVRRWSKKERLHINVPCPGIINSYNNLMGGVDLLDMIISLYRISTKTRRWHVKVLFHFADLAVANSWLCYRKENKALGKTMDYLEFRCKVAHSLINYEDKHKRGRPSLDELTTPAKIIRQVRPTDDSRFDQVCHFPMPKSLKQAQRCKLEKCKGYTRVLCSKCKIYLCCIANRNCFYDFHHK